MRGKVNYLNSDISTSNKCLSKINLIESIKIYISGLLKKIDQGALNIETLHQMEHRLYILIIQLIELMDLDLKRKSFYFIQKENDNLEKDYIKGLNSIIGLLKLFLSKYPFTNEKYKDILREKLIRLTRLKNELNRENKISDEFNNKNKLDKNISAPPWISKKIKK